MRENSHQELSEYTGRESVAFWATWKPVLTIRPHHLLDPEIKGAVIGKKIITFNGEGYRAMEDYQDEAVLYMKDTYGLVENGSSMTDPVKQVLKTLDDRDVIQVDIAKDDICNSCLIGKHCSATNYRMWGKVRNNPIGEQWDLYGIGRNLKNAGFEEEVDFLYTQTVHEYLNYDGNGLWEGVVPTPETVIFNSMLVKMGPLRTIFAR